MVEANMHRDKKTGLALGVLLVGIVGAFFFRNEADPNSDIPELEDSKILDDRIAERSVVPYLTGVETEQDEPTEPRSRGLSDDEMPSFLRDGGQSLTSRQRSNGTAVCRSRAISCCETGRHPLGVGREVSR
jgi:hypothetical protein